MPWDWIIFIGILLTVIYTAFVILNEKDAYLESAIDTPFFEFNLKIPSWWTQTAKEENLLKYERTDTRYDWYGWFEKKTCDVSDSEESLMEKEIQRMEIKFDEDQLIKEKIGPFLRYETTATQYGTERVYLDLCVHKKETEPYYYLMYSKSSVLNGLVEGPYFEEVLRHVRSGQNAQ